MGTICFNKATKHGRLWTPIEVYSISQTKQNKKILVALPLIQQCKCDMWINVSRCTKKQPVLSVLRLILSTIDTVHKHINAHKCSLFKLFLTRCFKLYILLKINLPACGLGVCPHRAKKLQHAGYHDTSAHLLHELKLVLFFCTCSSQTRESCLQPIAC